MFFVVRSNDSFNFPLGLIKYIVMVVVVVICCNGRNSCLKINILTLNVVFTTSSSGMFQNPLLHTLPLPLPFPPKAHVVVVAVATCRRTVAGGLALVVPDAPRTEGDDLIRSFLRYAGQTLVQRGAGNSGAGRRVCLRVRRVVRRVTSLSVPLGFHFRLTEYLVRVLCRGGRQCE